MNASAFVESARTITRLISFREENYGLFRSALAFGSQPTLTVPYIPIEGHSYYRPAIFIRLSASYHPDSFPGWLGTHQPLVSSLGEPRPVAWQPPIQRERMSFVRPR